MNKKTGWIIVVLVLIVIAIVVNTRKSSSQVIKIGVIAPITGGATTFGTGLANAIKLAEEERTGTKYNYELVIEDDATNPTQSANAAQKLINVDKVQALITTTSGTANAVKSIAAAAHVPHIAVASDVRIADNQFNFLNSVLPDEEAAAWLDEAVTHGAKTIAILAQNQPGFNLLTDNVKKLASGKGITVVFEDHFEPTVKDFNTNITKARQTKPDLYLIGAYPPALDILGQQFRNLGVSNVAGMATFPISATPELFNDRWYTDASLADASLQTQYQQKYPDFRFNVRVVPYGYDSFNLLVNGFESGNVTEYLLNLTSYPGKAGTLTKEKGNSIFHSPTGIWMIKDGKSIQTK